MEKNLPPQIKPEFRGEYLEYLSLREKLRLDLPEAKEVKPKPKTGFFDAFFADILVTPRERALDEELKQLDRQMHESKMLSDALLDPQRRPDASRYMHLKEKLFPEEDKKPS